MGFSFISLGTTPKYTYVVLALEKPSMYKRSVDTVKSSVELQFSLFSLENNIPFSQISHFGSVHILLDERVLKELCVTKITTTALPYKNFILV